MLEKRPLYPLRQTLEAARMERESARGPESGTPAFGASYINPHPLLTLARLSPLIEQPPAEADAIAARSLRSRHRSTLEPVIGRHG
jgi:hypothetical protein